MRGLGDTVGQDGGDEGSGDRVPVHLSVMTSDRWVWAPSGIWGPQTAKFLYGSRAIEGSVLLKAFIFSECFCL